MIKNYLQYPNEIAQMRHALRIGATREEYLAVIKALNRRVKFECPVGELIDALAGFAWAWKMKGKLSDVLPIGERDRFDAQGLEGKVSIECNLYDALFYAMQASSPYRSQIVDCHAR